MLLFCSASSPWSYLLQPSVLAALDYLINTSLNGVKSNCLHANDFDIEKRQDKKSSILYVYNFVDERLNVVMPLELNNLV